MDRPIFVDKYLQNARELNRLKAEQEKLRAIVLDELGENTYDDIYVTESERTEYEHDLIYGWVCQTYPELVGQVTRKALDWDQFVSLVNLGKIDFMAMPDYCDPKTKVQTIHTARRRK